MQNNKADVKMEAAARIASSMGTLNKLDLFWKHSDCPEKFKLLALDAVIRSKVLYGLESAELGTAMLN